MYTEYVNFNYDGERALFKTYTGATLTLILTINVCMYGMMRIEQMMTFVNANVSTSMHNNVYSEN